MIITVFRVLPTTLFKDVQNQYFFSWTLIFPGSFAEGRLGLAGLSGSWRSSVLAACALF